MSQTPDVLVLGGGPGGYVAALRCAQLGLSVVCVELDKTLGGTCVNVGCIPSKAMLQSSEHFEFTKLHAKEHGVIVGDVHADLATMLKRKDDVVSSNTKGVEFLFKKNKVTWAKGRGTVKSVQPTISVDVVGTDGSSTTYTPKHLIIATGSVPFELPFLKFDEERILSNVGGLRIPEIPGHLIVVGGGYIGLEMGSVWRRLGAKVTVIEATPSILPGQEEDIQKEAAKIFAKQGLTLRTNTKVIAGGRTETGAEITVEADGKQETIAADYVLVAIGRKPSLNGVDAAALGLKTTDRGV
ncbi:MAG: FAD-dependent oxidoreductase, partial [Gemmatimonadaceae bacterium]|nr:FAD-dependent oxidoreductase [Gemmatimonadaceae bacterium]